MADNQQNTTQITRVKQLCQRQRVAATAARTVKTNQFFFLNGTQTYTYRLTLKKSLDKITTKPERYIIRLLYQFHVS